MLFLLKKIIDCFFIYLFFFKSIPVLSPDWLRGPGFLKLWFGQPWRWRFESPIDLKKWSLLVRITMTCVPIMKTAAYVLLKWSWQRYWQPRSMPKGIRWMLCKVWSYTSQYSLILSCLSWLSYLPFVFVVKIIVEVNYR